MLDFKGSGFLNVVEVVPPAGPDAAPILAALDSLSNLPVAAFSVASNPVAKPRMSALAMCTLIRQRSESPVIMHCTTRDHNRLGQWSLLCGAKALGIHTVLIATGDFVALGERHNTTTVRDVDVYALVGMARTLGLQAGVVFDPHLETGDFDSQVHRLKRKAVAGAHFVVTQPVYDAAAVADLATALAFAGLPVLLGILPLRSARHADFLHHQVSGIAVPTWLRERMVRAEDPVAEGVSNARDVLAAARMGLAGACVMPPFGHYQVVERVLRTWGGTA